MIVYECLDYCAEQFANAVIFLVTSILVLFVAVCIIGAIALVAYIFTKKDDDEP